MWLVLVLMFAVFAGSRDATETLGTQVSGFPRNFHLDNYELCLMKTSGVYCMGTFEIVRGPHHIYNSIKQYSLDKSHFNRTLLHRGYCLSERCAAVNGTPAQRFQQCVSRWAQHRSLSLQLHTLEYCHDHKHLKMKSKETLQDGQVYFLAAIAVIGLLNLLGMIYEAWGGKLELFRAWSFPTNAQRIFSDDVDHGSCLPVAGAQTLLCWLVTIAHIAATHTRVYLDNPTTVEQIFQNPLMVVLQSSLLIQIGIMMSCFLTAENLIQKELSIGLILKSLMMKIFRMVPLYVVTVWFASWWWAHTRGGPQWRRVEDHARACRRVVPFLENLLGTTCLDYTLYICLDLQLYIVTCVVLMLRGKRPLVTLLQLMGTSCVLTGVAAAWRDWTPMVVAMGPESLRSSFSKEPTFHEWYTKPWGYFTVCFGGLAMAFLFEELKKYNTKVLLRRYGPAAVCLTCLLVAVWLGASQPSLGARAALLAVEGLVAVAVAGTLSLLAFSHGLNDFLSWWLWDVLSRLTPFQLATHSMFTLTVAFSRPALYHVSYTDLWMQWPGMTSVTYLGGIAFVAMLDAPLQRLAALVA